MPIGLGLLFYGEGIGAGGGGHAPEAEGCPVGAGHDDGPGHDAPVTPDLIGGLILYVNISAHGRDGAVEGIGHNLRGFFAGGDKGVAFRDAGKEGWGIGKKKAPVTVLNNLFLLISKSLQTLQRFAGCGKAP